jgi:hypothetical protein
MLWEGLINVTWVVLDVVLKDCNLVVENFALSNEFDANDGLVDLHLRGTLDNFGFFQALYV